MNQSSNDIELIERYFDNALTDQENDHLKSRMKTDQELKRLFEQEKLLISTIRYQAAQKDLQFLKQIEKNLNKPKPLHFIRHWHYYAAAACVTLLIIAGLIFPLKDASPEKLYADYFKPYPNVFEPAVRGADVFNQRKEAFLAYENADYKRAVQLFTLLQKENSDPGILLLLGNANLMLGNTSGAQQNFNDLITQYDDLDLQAKWFLSLAYLKSGEIDQARKLLEELGNTEISYSEKAKELLQKVD